MSQQYIRLALVQMVLILFVIVFTGFSLKARFAPLPTTAFPVLIRSYGFLLLLAPATWCIWATWQSRRQTHDTRDEALIAVTGIGLCVAIVLLGWFSCSVAWTARGIVTTDSRPIPARSEPVTRNGE